MKPRLIRNLILISAASLGLAACNEGYGYGGMSYGWGSGYYDGYYGSPYYGWYDGWYYPGSGYYVYDRSGVRRSWNDGQRRYWEGRRGNWNGGNWNGRQNWNGYRNPNWNNNGNRGTWQGRGNWNGNRSVPQGSRGNWGNRNPGTTTTAPNTGTPDTGNRPPWRGRQ